MSYGTIAVTNNEDPQNRTYTGRLEVFTDSFNAWVTPIPLVHIWQTYANNGWSSWGTLGGNGFGLVVGQNRDGRLEAFSISLPLVQGVGGLLHIWQTVASGFPWSSWESLGGSVSQIAVAQYFRLPARTQGYGAGQNSDGRLEVFGLDAHGSLLHIWQNPPPAFWSSPWSSWDFLGSGYQIYQVVVGQNLDGRLEVFAIDWHGTPLHLWQEPSPTGGWSNWSFLGSSHQVSQIAIGQNYDGRLEVFGVDGHGTALHIWQLTPGGSWSDWEYLGSGYQINQIAVGQNADGRLELFAVDFHATPLHIWQLTPGGDWGVWAFLGSGHPASQLAVGQNQDGRLEVFDLDPHGALFHIWQQAPPIGNWSTWTNL